MADQTNTQQSNAPAEKINGFKDLYPRQTGFSAYSVLSLRNGSPTAHRVNTMELSCTCKDNKMNKSGSAEVCDHVAVALYQHDGSIDFTEQAAHDLAQIVSDARKAADELRETKDLAKTIQNANAAAASEETEDEDLPPMPEPDVPDAHDMAERLSEAYEEAGIEDMQVKVNSGLVWPQTGKETPETLPGPGGVDTFEALLQRPDMVEYVHDDHELVTEKPGEWFKNAMKPQDVEKYIEGVLR